MAASCPANDGAESVFVSDLAIRHATEKVKTACDYVEVCDLPKESFSGNDFNGFDLRVKLLPGDGSDLDVAINLIGASAGRQVE